MNASYLRIALAVGACALLPMSPFVHAVDEIAVFELEADAVDSGGLAGDDWDTVNLGGGGDAVAATGVLSDPAPSSIFTGGGSKDHADINQWKHKAGSVPDKDNITNAYAAAYKVEGDLVIYFGADRFANDGSAQLGFWFFQDNVTLRQNGTFSGAHRVGDVLVLANFEQGGDVPIIQVLRWVGSGGDTSGTLDLLVEAANAECGHLLGSHETCAVANRVPTASPWAYTPKQGTPGVFPIVSFFEGGINITQIFEQFAGGNIPCFASFLAETRSSTSVGAVLKDFVLGAFPVCGIEITQSCTGCELNAEQTAFVYAFNGTVTNTGFGTVFDVTVVSDKGTPGDSSDDQTFLLGSLGAGQSANYSGTFESLLNPPTIKASVSAATEPDGPAAVSDVSESAACTQCVRVPGIEVTKQCSPRLAVSDNLVVVEITFSGQVCNTGDTRLEDVMVTDDAGTPGDPSDDEVILIGSLDVGACEPFSGSYLPRTANSSDPSLASFSDTVTAEGDAALGFGHPTDTATATCPLCPECP